MKLTAWSTSIALLLCAHSLLAAPSTPAPPPNVAAIVDGHVIPMDHIVRVCVREERDYVVGRMIQAYVIDRESKRRGIVVAKSEIDARVAKFAKNVAPQTVDETLAQHHLTMADLRDDFRVAIERDRLTEAAVKPTRMVHCREIALRCTPDGASGPKYTSAGALKALHDVQAKLKAGANFDALGATDLGVLYDKMLNVDAAVLDCGLKLRKGEVSGILKTQDGYCLVKAVSTSDNHPKKEDALYHDASAAYRKTQIMFLQPQVIGALINNSKLTFAKDSDIVDGKPLPAIAATVDGHPIPMAPVVEKCVAGVGHSAAEIAVEYYVVDRECARRGITVADAEIDAQLDDLRKRIAPKTLEQGLAEHHTTLDGLRNDLRQQVERMKLAMANVEPTPMVHAQVIFIRCADNDPNAAQPAGFAPADEAQRRILALKGDLDHGDSFDDLADRYSEMGKNGDMGILYAGISGVDTAVLDTALKMHPGDVTPKPIKTYGGYFLLRAVSTSDSHPTDEDTAYAAALDTYREQQADMQAPQTVSELVAKCKVVNYLP